MHSKSYEDRVKEEDKRISEYIGNPFKKEERKSNKNKEDKTHK
jgi:hypothetical protein